MSAAPQNDDKPNEDHYDGTPGARNESAVTVFNNFESELRERANSIFSMLPSNVSPEKFRNTALAAVKKNPDLLKCTMRTLFSAITSAALDGLMPDGKEGVIQDRNVKVSKRNQADRWETHATWQPMFHGLRKRSRELDGLLVDAQVVYKNDLFKRIQGDDPKLVHEPTDPDKDPGPMIAVYAIFKREDGTILHREVMRKSEVEDTRATSKQPDGLMWKTFTTEAWRKTVGRRGFKSVPVSENMAAILDRDDRTNYDFVQHEPVAVMTPPPAPPPAPKALDHKPTQTLPEGSGKAAETVPANGDAKTAAPRRNAGEPRRAESVPEPLRTPASIAAEEIGGPPSAYEDWIGDIYAELQGCESDLAVEDLRDRALNDLDDTDKPKWKEACADRATAIFGAKKK